jgi:hypothetical protein
MTRNHCYQVTSSFILCTILNLTNGIKTIHQSTDQEFVDITWEIVYSGRSHLELMFLDAYPGSYVNMTETEEVLQNLQHNSEIIRQCYHLNFCRVLCLYGHGL